MSSTALIKPGLSDLMTLGDVFKASGYFKDVRDQSQAVVKILYGQELGFSPVISMMGIHIIEGKPALSSNLLGALVKRSGKYNYTVPVLTDTECLVSFTENGQSCGDSTFNISDATRAGVMRAGSGWTKYPRNMLFARALSNGVKLFCPELSACPIYIPEELGADVNEEGAIISHPVAVPERTTEPRVFGKPNGSADLGSGGESKGSPLPATETDALADALTRSLQNTGDSLQFTKQATEILGPDSDIEYITVGQQRNFHKECRATVKPARSMEADSLTYQWLKDNGYVNERGEPTAGKIAASGWLTERRKALDWLRQQ